MYLPAGISDEDDSEDDFECSSRMVNRRSAASLQRHTENERNNKETEVEIAAASGDLELLKKILENGSNVNINLCLNGSWTALMHASFHIQYEVVEYLLDFGANPNGHSASITPLLCVCSYTGAEEEMQLQCLRLLIDRGALINAGDKFGLTPLMKLVEFGRLQVIEELITLGANIEMRDSQGWTAIFWAVYHGKQDTVQLLVEKGARLQEVDKKGRNLIDLALTDYHQPVVDYLNSLQKTDVDMNIKENQFLEDIKSWNHFFPGISAADNQPAYTAEIPTLLLGMRCNQLIPLFTKEKLTLRAFLLLDEADMIRIGVEFPYERNRLKIGLHKFHLANWSLESVAGLTATKMKHFDIMALINTLGSHMRQVYILEASIQYMISNFINPVINAPIDKDKIMNIDNDLIKGAKEVCHMLSVLKNEIQKLKVDLQKMQTRNPPPVDFIQPPNVTKQKSFRTRTKTLVLTGFVAVIGITIANRLISFKS